MKKYFVTGLVIFLPLAVTLLILRFLILFFTKPFAGFTSHLIQQWNLFPDGLFIFSKDQVIQYLSRILILIALIGFTILLGLVTRWFFMNSLLKFCDRILFRIPIVNTLYKTAQDIIKTLFSSDKNTFEQVVMLSFPRPGIYVLGLIATDAPDFCSKAADKNLISVLVPTTPNPTTGFLLMVPKEELIYLDMKAKDAIKYIVSCGVITPKENPKEAS
jgi:uncharacterized membrane protein